MAALSPSNTRLLRRVGIIVALIAIALFGLGLAGRTELPLYIPLLLLGAASALVLASRTKTPG